MRGRVLFLSVMVFGLMLTALIVKNGDIAWIAVLLILYMVTGIIQSPATDETKITARHSVAKMRKEGQGYTIDLVLEVRNEGSKTLCIRLSDHPYKETSITDGSRHLGAVIRPGEMTEVSYTLSARRGSFIWENLDVIASDPFGLFPLRKEIQDAGGVLVPPSYTPYRPFIIRPWKTLSSPGIIPIRMGGSGIDFFGVREYQPGDPLKLLDWRMTARHPHRFFTREFVQEKTADIALILDGRRSMDIRVGSESLLDIQIREVASSAEVFLRQGHRVGLTIIGNSSMKVMPDYGKKQLNRILKCLAESRAESEQGRGRFRYFSGKHLSPKAMVMVFSPLDYDDIILFKRLRAQGLQTVLICPDTLEHIQPEDDSAARALRICRLERKLNLSLISRLSVTVIDWNVKHPLQGLLRKHLGHPAGIRRM